MEDIKRFLDSGTGLAMKEYLQARLDELKDIDNIKEINVATQQAIEVKAQKRAYDKLQDILKEIMTLSQPVKSKDPRDSYEVGVER